MFNYTIGNVSVSGDSEEEVTRLAVRSYLRDMNNGEEPEEGAIDILIAKQDEMRKAPLTAIEFFLKSPAAMNFIRLTPEQQSTAINGMTATQRNEVLKYLAVAVSALIKERYLK